jgi:membrane protease YdiL (CAAX protease family)
MTLNAMFGNIKPKEQLLVITGFVLVCLVVFSFLSIVCANILFGVDLLKNPNVGIQLAKPEMISALKFMQSIQAIGVFIIPSVIFLIYFKNKNNDWLALSNKPTLNQLILIFICVICLSPTINFLAELNSWIPFPQWVYDSEAEALKITKAFLQMNSIDVLLINLFVVAILPGIGEELLFRGVLQNIFKNVFNNTHVSIWLTAILFSAMHMQFLGFIPRMLLGALFGYLYIWSGSIWLPMIAHFINNGVAVLMGYFISINTIDASTENIGSTIQELWIVTIGLGTSIFTIYSLKKSFKVATVINE